MATRSLSISGSPYGCQVGSMASTRCGSSCWTRMGNPSKTAAITPPAGEKREGRECTKFRVKLYPADHQKGGGWTTLCGGEQFGRRQIYGWPVSRALQKIGE